MKKTQAKSKKTNANDGAVRQSLLIGLGLFDLSRAKVERYLAGLKKDLPVQARKKAADDFIKSIQSNSKKLEHSTRTQIKTALDAMSSKVDPN